MEHRLRIAHFSDLHERVALERMSAERKAKIRLSEVERKRVLNHPSFRRAFEESRAEQRLIWYSSLVMLADWGLPEEYERAGKRFEYLLDLCGVASQRLFVIPGNHDVQRS